MRSACRDIVERALSLVHVDAPRCADAIVDALRPIEIALSIDRETMYLSANDQQVVVQRTTTSLQNIVLRVSGAVIVDLVEGRLELLPAILASSVYVRTPPVHAHRVFDVMNRFVEGCARSVNGPALWNEFRSYVAESAERN